MHERRFVERTDPGEVFSALADETRVGILQALWEADGSAMAFSDLREAVGTRDSGQFNYHLDTLVGPFVTKSEEGYRLTQAGKRINGAIATGAYTMEGSFEPVVLDEPCSTCGGTRTLHYNDEEVRIDCDSCPISFGSVVPPAVFAECDREEIPRVTSRYLQTAFRHVSNGFCWFCEGRVGPTVAPTADIFEGDGRAAGDVSEEFAERMQAVPSVRYDCQRCGVTTTVGLDLAVSDHPAVVAFYHDHGIDVRELLIWDFHRVDTDRLTVRSREPFRASVTYRIDGDTLTVVVDETRDVIEIER